MRGLVMLISALTGLSCWAQGSITGTVKDSAQNPMAFVGVKAEASNGQTFQTLTQSNGHYTFNNLPDADYLITVNVPIGYVLRSPSCSFELVPIQNGGSGQATFELELRTGGIAVEFGSPGGGQLVPLSNDQFSVTVFVSNLASVGYPAPDTLFIRGYWTIPGETAFSSQVVSGQAAGVYTTRGLSPLFQNKPNGSVELSINLNTPPFINVDGALATYTFQLPAGTSQTLDGLDRLAFCLEYVGAFSNQETLNSIGSNWVGRVFRLD
ncbi:MAG: carboxypeptidase regulatory-like domain-containing protein [Acidobacteria bacterium]|nr:carboxypeptidase regulatory-like domain-containing protein [Acidobacteriota bacterium]MCB9396942.1 carboxypeptidase regulatory-like domain-containing protein [Acidobacteriota bacterium]